MHNRRLNNCKDWTEFDSSDENSKTLSGVADMDIYSTTEMPGQEDKRFEGLALRLFNPKTRLCRAFLLQGYVQRQTYYRDVSLGCTKQGSPGMESGVFFRQRQNLGMELA